MGMGDQLNKINSSYAKENDNFGYSVAMDGDYSVIGSYADSTTTRAGTITIYKVINGQYTGYLI